MTFHPSLSVWLVRPLVKTHSSRHLKNHQRGPQTIPSYTEGRLSQARTTTIAFARRYYSEIWFRLSKALLEIKTRNTFKLRSKRTELDTLFAKPWNIFKPCCPARKFMKASFITAPLAAKSAVRRRMGWSYSIRICSSWKVKLDHWQCQRDVALSLAWSDTSKNSWMTRTTRD